MDVHPTERTSLLHTQEAGESTNDNLEPENDDEPLTIVERVGEILETVQETVVNVQETVVEEIVAVVEEIQDAGEVFVEELHQADDEEDKYHLLDMSLARGLSLLPADIAEAADLYETPAMMTPSNVACKTLDPFNLFPQEVIISDQLQEETILEEQHAAGNLEVTMEDAHRLLVEEKHQHHHHEPLPKDDVEIQKPILDDSLKKQEEEHESIPITAYFLLISAVICLSTTGPFFNLQQDVDPVMKIFWRTSATNCILFPLLIRGIMAEGIPSLDFSQWVMVFVAGFSYSCLGIFFVLSLDYTSVGNAMILNNSQALILMLGKFFVGERISNLEMMGAAIAFSGAVLCSVDAADQDPKAEVGGFDGKNSNMTLWGDAFGLISAFGGVGYLVFAQKVRSQLNLYIFMFLNMFQNSLYALALIVVSGREYTWDMERYHGLFSWLSPSSPDRLLLTVIAVVFCNFLGVMGYIRAMHYFDKLVISVAGLMEPVVATVLAYGLSVGLLPGWKGWLGNIFVAGGTFLVIYRPPSKRVDGASKVAH